MSTLAISGIGALFFANLLLQALDGLLTYQVLLVGVPEANPLIHATIIEWGPLWGLFWWKALACVLLLFVYVNGQRCRLLSSRGLRLTAVVYGWFGFLALCEWFLYMAV